MTLTPVPSNIPHVAGDQGCATRAAYGRDLAVTFADRSARVTAVGRNLRVASGLGAVEWQNPLSAAVKPQGHGGFQRVSPFAGRHDRDAVGQFRFAHPKFVIL